MTYRKLRRRHQLFVDHYVECGIGAEAVRRMGEGQRHPDRIANKLLARPEVQLAVTERQDEAIIAAGVRPVRILEEVARVAFFNVQDLLDPETGEMLPIHKWPRAAAAAIGGLDIERKVTRSKDGQTTTEVSIVKPRAVPKNEALKFLGHYKRLLIERHEHGGPNGGPIPVAAAALVTSDPTEMDAAKAYLKMLTGE